jgi:DNA-binding SARP family transcriptional activator
MTVTRPRDHLVSTSYHETTSVHLFGGPYVVDQGRELAVPDGSKRLLALVALRAGRVDRHQVAGTLWPVLGEERAAGNLRSALWRLRCAGIDVIDVDKHSVGLRSGTILDLELVRTWTLRLIQGAPGDDDLRLPSWTPGEIELLPGWCEDWVLFERERTRQRVVHAMEFLSRRLVRDGRAAEAVEAALYAVRMDPLRETAQATLIHAHISEGNLAEAKHAFASYRELLRCEMGIVPGPAIAALFAAAAPDAAPSAGTRPRPSPEPDIAKSRERVITSTAGPGT